MDLQPQDQHCTFANVSFLDAKLDNCTFLNCEFLDCYFRKTEIVSSVFTGCKFEDCTFTELGFVDTTFEFPTFRGCFIEFRDFSAQLPEDPGMRLKIADELAREAGTLGAARDARLYRLVGASAYGGHLRNIALASGSNYYRTHFELGQRIEAALTFTRQKFLENQKSARIEERGGGGGSVRNGELAVDVLEVLGHRGRRDPELERDRVVFLPACDAREDLPFACRQLLDPDMALIEHEYAQRAGTRDPNMEPAISARNQELALAEDGGR
jgi:Pentapeptide repeats (9 copies)